MSNTIEPWQDPTKTPYIKIRGLSKSFGSKRVLHDLDLDIYKEEFFSLLGPSGCGKTTLMRILAGFETADSGSIYIGGIDMNDLPPHDRPVNMMFQSYALFPHMNVFDNIAFGLKQEGMDKDKINKRVSKLIKLVHLEECIEQYPNQLSGGQAQRVALARCLAKKPKLVLLDEPMAALDKQLREKTQFELVNIQEEVGVTFVMVTHDQEEAMTMSTRVAIMNEGRLKQIGTPHEIYEYPNSLYVANFFGNMNIFNGITEKVGEKSTIIAVDGFESKIVSKSNNSIADKTSVSIAIRPEKIKISKKPPVVMKNNWVKGIVDEIAYLGDVSIYHTTVANDKLTIMSTIANISRSAESSITWGDEVYLSWDSEFVMIFNDYE